MAIDLIYRKGGGGAVSSVNGKTGTVVLTAEDVGAATQEDFENALNNLSGTVEVTDENPSKAGTVLTINPDGEEINIYSAEEVDAMIEELRQAILSLQSE